MLRHHFLVSVQRVFDVCESGPGGQAEQHMMLAQIGQLDSALQDLKVGPNYIQVCTDGVHMARSHEKTIEYSAWNILKSFEEARCTRGLKWDKLAILNEGYLKVADSLVPLKHV